MSAISPAQQQPGAAQLSTLVSDSEAVQAGSRQRAPRSHAAGCYDMELLWTAVLPVPLPHNLGARVEHFYLDGASGLATELIAQHMGLPLDFIARLMWFGAIYTCPVVPAPPPGATGGIDKAMQDSIAVWRTAGIKLHGKNVRRRLFHHTLGMHTMSSPDNVLVATATI